MGTENADQIMLGPVAVYIGTAGVTAATSLGYTDEEGAEFSYEPETLEVKTGQRLGVVKHLITDRKATIKCNLQQVTLEALAAVLPGVTQNGNELYADPTSTAINELSVKLVGLDPNGYPRIFEMLYATATGSPSIKLAAGEIAKLPAEFTGLASGSKVFSITDGDGDMVKTISNGTFARVAGTGYHQINGEGGVADTLTNITGSNLTDGELLILQIYSASAPITITHEADTIALAGGVDWTMTKRGDTLYLRYASSGTKWVEIGRYDDPS